MVNDPVAGLGTLARKAYRKAMGFWLPVFDRKTILVFRRKIDFAHQKYDFRIQEYGTNVRDIIDVYKSVSRYNYYSGSDDDTRMASRLRHGMKFYTAFEGDKVIAYLWLHSGSYRFFNEIGIFIKHGPNDLWLRDVYVVPGKRGQRIFRDVIRAVIQEYYPNTRNLYSDAMRDNSASLKAHKNLEMTVVGHVRFTRILRWIVFREVKAEPLETYGYQFPRKVIFMDADFNLFTAVHRT